MQGPVAHGGRIVPEERFRMTVTKREFEYACRCKRLGHEWTETRSEETEPSMNQVSSEGRD